jgi:[CysO sulfur-carrier protein]-S-L-cysteine hydrolase
MITVKLPEAQIDQIILHARESAPRECCGLIGGNEGRGRTIYRMRNIASNPLITYEAAPEDLFAAQRVMRNCGEDLLAIYHSHPRSRDPQPSETDVRLAYYPSAVYLIVGLGDHEACLRAFHISEGARSWEPAALEVIP